MKKFNFANLTVASSIIGVAATVYFAAHDTLKASEILKDKELSIFEKADYAIPLYTSTIISGTLTIGSILANQYLNNKRYNNLLQSYILLEQFVRGYRRYYSTNLEQHNSNSTSCVFFEEHYGRFFERDMIEIIEAEALLNKKLISEGRVTLNDFYSFLGLESHFPNNFGWTQELICDFYNPAWVDFEHELVILDDGLECYKIRPAIEPDNIW